MSFGEKLAKLRKEKGISQEDLAQELNVSRQAVSKWESNSAYPETEKIVLICKFFDASMDELIGIKETKEKHSNYYYDNLKNILNEFIKGIKMFYNMTFKQKIKCLFEMGFYLVVLILFSVILTFILSEIFTTLFSLLPNTILYNLRNIFVSIINLIFLIIICYIVIKLYKIRYLDYYEESKPNIILEKENKEKINIKEEKIIIRDAKNDFDFFNYIKKFCLLSIKFFVGLFTFPVIIFFVFLLAFIIFILSFINNGIILLYIVIALIGCLILTFIILELCIKFIFKLQVSKKRIFILFIVSLIVLAVGCGLFASELSTYKIVKNENYNIKVSELNIDMQDNLIINYFNHYNTEIVYEDRDNILVDFYAVEKDFINVYNYTYYNNNNFNNDFVIYDYNVNYLLNNESFSDLINYLSKYIKNKEIPYNDYDIKIVIHISEDNYNKINNNNRYYFE